MTVPLLDPCQTFVPTAYRWVWIVTDEGAGGLLVGLTAGTDYRREPVCARCDRPHVEHTHEIVEHYTAAGPFMTAAPTIKEIDRGEDQGSPAADRLVVGGETGWARPYVRLHP